MNDTFPNSCTRLAPHFIPDQIWIEYDDATEKYNMIILEIKLSEGTNLTPGQTAAKNDVPWVLRYKQAKELDMDLSDKPFMPALEQGFSVNTISFYKGFKHPQSGELRVIKMQ